MADLNPADQIQLKIDSLIVVHGMVDALRHNVMDAKYRGAISDSLDVISSLIAHYRRYIKQPKAAPDDQG